MRIAAAVGLAAFTVAFFFAAALSWFTDARAAQCGIASRYGRESGRITANGERFPTGEATAAHRTLPFGTLVFDRAVRHEMEERRPAPAVSSRRAGSR